MKLFIPFFMSLLTFMSCNTQKSVADETNATSQEVKRLMEQMPVLEYEAISRGFYKKYVVEDKQIVSTLQREAQPIIQSISENDLQELASALAKIDVNNLKDLEAPSKTYQYDAAPFATLKVIQNGMEYTTPTFDNGNPPEEIKELVNKILGLAPEK